MTDKEKSRWLIHIQHNVPKSYNVNFIKNWIVLHFEKTANFEKINAFKFLSWISEFDDKIIKRIGVFEVDKPSSYFNKNLFDEKKINVNGSIFEYYELKPFQKEEEKKEIIKSLF
jgi:hypothetical protein